MVEFLSNQNCPSIRELAPGPETHKGTVRVEPDRQTEVPGK